MPPIKQKIPQEVRNFLIILDEHKPIPFKGTHREAEDEALRLFPEGCELHVEGDKGGLISYVRPRRRT